MLKIKSTEDYNRGVMEFENSFAHPVGFSSNILGQPSDCRYVMSSSSSNKIEEFDEEEDEEIEDESGDDDGSTCSSEGSADGVVVSCGGPPSCYEVFGGAVKETSLFSYYACYGKRNNILTNNKEITYTGRILSSLFLL